MTMRLSETQRAFLKSQPTPEGHFTKIRLALRIVGANLGDLGDAAQVSAPQLTRYLVGGDLMLSTAGRIADIFGLDVCDLWPVTPKAKAVRGRRAAARAKAANGKRTRPTRKAQVAA